MEIPGSEIMTLMMPMMTMMTKMDSNNTSAIWKKLSSELNRRCVRSIRH